MEQPHARFIDRWSAIREILGHLLQPNQCDEIADVYARLAGGEVRAETIVVPHVKVSTCGLWHRWNASAEEEFYPPSALESLLGQALERADDGTVAAIYRQVMWIRAFQGFSADGMTSGFWVFDEMERFHCLRCGKCCAGLQDAYKTIVLDADVTRWEEQGRSDILAYVDRCNKICRAWVDPVTRHYLSACPWLQAMPSRQEFQCCIHATKPQHCAAYPHTKRHALKTGCRGFDHFYQGSRKPADNDTITPLP